MTDTLTPRPADAHPSATHVDSWGMPTAFYDDEHLGRKVAYYPTPCCGASAKGLEGGIGCRKCYRYIDPSFGGVPQEPFTPLEPAK